MNFKEIEYKYRADEVSLEDFTAICSHDEYKKILASGYDYFYESRTTPGAFCRHRVGADMNQLTFKRKTTDKNNYVRTEHNLDLKPKTSVDQVRALCAEFGYAPAKSIFKSCFIYKYENYTFVYYVCYDTNMDELGRFIEIELAEDRDFGTEDLAILYLNTLEAKLKPLGLKPNSRVKKSLFELFVQGSVSDV